MGTMAHSGTSALKTSKQPTTQKPLSVLHKHHSSIVEISVEPRLLLKCMMNKKYCKAMNIWGLPIVAQLVHNSNSLFSYLIHKTGFIFSFWLL